MTTFEIAATAILLVMLLVVGAVVFQVRAIVREVRAVVRDVGAEGVSTREHLTAGVNGLIEMQTAELTALRVWMENRPQVARQIIQQAEAAAPKPHACRFKLNSEERTNKMIRRISICETPGCRNVHVDEEPEDAPRGDQD